MDYTEFASDLPLDRTTVFRSAEENEEVMQRLGVKQAMRQMGAGLFRSDLAVRSTQQAEFYADRFNRAVSMYLEPPEGTVGILFPRSASGRFLVGGRDVGTERLVVFPAQSGIDIVIPDLAGSEAIAIPQAQFAAMAEVLCPTCRCPEGLTIVEGDGKQLHQLRRTVISLVNDEVQPTDEQLANFLAETVAQIACSSELRPLKASRYGPQARRRIAKLTQEYIEEHHRETVRIEDFCRETGVGIRTLQRCFRAYFDVTISAYLKTVRLNAAARELAAAQPTDDTVTRIALRHGFNHLGRFSAEFHQRFGALPKDVLTMQRLEVHLQTPGRADRYHGTLISLPSAMPADLQHGQQVADRRVINPREGNGI